MDDNLPLEVADGEHAESGGELLDVGEWMAGDVDLFAAWIAGGDDEPDVDDSDTAASKSSGATSVSTPSPSSAMSVDAVSRDRNPTRQRRRQEIEYLRARAAEMERELAQLRGEAATAPSEWEAIARRQQRAREKSELENLKLRGMLESQLKLARTLERLLRKREGASSLDSHSSKRMRPARVVEPLTALSDSEAFERLLGNIDHSYAETKAVLTANGLWTAPRGHRRVEVKQRQARNTSSSGIQHEEAMHELYVEMTDVTTLPFSMDATADAAWRCITGGFMQLDHEVYMDLAGQHDVLAIKYAITLSQRRLRVDFTARAAMKRFVEGDQIVDVWESISDTAGDHTSRCGSPGIRVRERGWTVFRCADGDPTRTLQLTCMQMMPLISYDNDSATKSSEDRQAGLLTNLALDYYGDQLDLAQQAMETLLLDETRGTRSAIHIVPLITKDKPVPPVSKDEGCCVGAKE